MNKKTSLSTAASLTTCHFLLTTYYLLLTTSTLSLNRYSHISLNGSYGQTHYPHRQ